MRRDVVPTVMFGILGLVQTVVLLVVELIPAMLVYIYLNLYQLETFGFLVRLSSYVRDVLVAQMEYWLPVSTNVAYATLLGELGPKSFLLLLIGLVVGSIIRLIVSLVGRLMG